MRDEGFAPLRFRPRLLRDSDYFCRMQSSCSRRDVLRAGALSLAASIWPWRAFAETDGNSGSFTFIAVNDLHYHDPACAEWFRKTVAAMKNSAPKAEFCLLGGDLADQGKPEQLAGIRDAFKLLGIPIFAVPGNHDHITDTDRRAYETLFPKQTNYLFENRGWQVIGLDSTQGLGWKQTTISAVTLTWLDDTLPKLDRQKPTIVFTHFPLGPDVIYRPLNAEAVLDRLAEFNVQAAFSGHWHGYTERTVRDVSLTTDRCCSRFRNNHDGSKEKGWFVCEAHEGKVTRRFVEAPLAAPAAAPAPSEA